MKFSFLFVRSKIEETEKTKSDPDESFLTVDGTSLTAENTYATCEMEERKIDKTMKENVFDSFIPFIFTGQEHSSNNNDKTTTANTHTHENVCTSTN